jgi:hypothetical protein
MLEPAALGAPDEAAVGQNAEIVVEVDPRLRGFAQHDRAGACDGIDREQIELRLRAILALHIERLAVRRPIDPRQIDIGIGPRSTFTLFDPSGAITHNSTATLGLPAAG